MANWERARSDEQKQARSEEVLAIAKTLLLSQPFDSIRIATIAKELSFTRGNLYKYFQSKEEIYLSLLALEVERFTSHLHASLDNVSPNQGPSSFIDFWTTNLARERAMLMLMSAAGNILEKNCSDSVLVYCKHRIAQATAQWTVPVFQSFFPDWSTERIHREVHLLVVLATGLHGYCGLTTSQQDLLRANGLESMLLDEFQTEYRNLLLHVQFGNT